MANDRKTQCLPLLGVGKTTLVKKVCDAVVSAGVSVSGFYTEEVRERGRRVGFDVATLTRDRGRLSRLRYRLSPPAGGRECRVGQYVVNLQSFESLALPLFRDVWILCILFNFNRRSILGTIPVPKAKPLALVEEVCSRQDVKIFMVKICFTSLNHIITMFILFN
uniref:Nucleoside-triphosphatase, cancer-related n=1 Tax=Sinocyclocheilus anshuiensis TaxID=1608454 RepID=A0A671LGZ7_9TELE